MNSLHVPFVPARWPQLDTALFGHAARHVRRRGASQCDAKRAPPELRGGTPF